MHCVNVRLLKESDTKQWSAHILIVKKINQAINHIREDNPVREITSTFVHVEVVFAEMG